ncbi:MAG: CRISPR-associated CARF protein Csa3 [Desulfurococcales archaeon]|nr:CRISPR-associated CARF protein Csa3 [Desulfurococcales archaeon]
MDLPPAWIIATLGFEEKYIVRCTLRYSTRFRIGGVTLYTATPTDEYSEERVSNAFRQAVKVLGYMGIEPRLERMNPYRYLQNIEDLRRLILEKARSGYVIVCITGGLRIIGATLLSAALLLPSPPPRNVIVSIEHDVEQGYVEAPLEALEKLRSLSGREMLVYEAVKELGEAGPTDISRELGIPKTSAWRILNRLAERGLLVRSGRRFRART